MLGGGGDVLLRCYIVQGKTHKGTETCCQLPKHQALYKTQKEKTRNVKNT